MNFKVEWVTQMLAHLSSPIVKCDAENAIHILSYHILNYAPINLVVVVARYVVGGTYGTYYV